MAGAALALSLGLATSASASGKYIDLSGNVVFYENQPHSWPSATAHLDWQTDGNLVLYCNNGRPIWASNTYHAC
ncbi:hypothetical protein DN069_10135 [Streptacidiphilus pinicola]|uniref:Bulb-type lectin domain-containing protein n=1 Tax=Streptacidiphilus pinicola TaxID=2219663 RepID=A0A2X0IRK0_9ACTN|nr:hypothetical protein [Streptacidiphilus pinicola]RAG85851.1 hypothetical protein DN069_10135 [Streptacidiphilus pinicola]